MDKNILLPKKPFVIVLRCPACGTALEPPTRHSCGSEPALYQASTALPVALLEDLSDIAEYLRAVGDGHIERASLGMVA